MDQRIPDDVREIMEVSIDRCHSGLKLNKDSTICKIVNAVGFSARRGVYSSILVEQFSLS